MDNTSKDLQDLYIEDKKEGEDKKDKEIKELKKKILELEEELKVYKKYEKVIKCIKGENGSKCIISDFLPIDNIPEDIKSTLSIFNEKINEKFPVTLGIPYKNGGPCNNQTLGNQIPNEFKQYIGNEEELSPLLKFLKMKWMGYPDEKVIINGIDIPFLWEWKSTDIHAERGPRIVISKFPNKRIPATFDDCDVKYHLWVCLEYEKVEDNESKRTRITITKMNIHCISPNTVLNTKFELSTTEDLIKSEISNGNINKL